MPSLVRGQRYARRLSVLGDLHQHESGVVVVPCRIVIEVSVMPGWKVIHKCTRLKIGKLKRMLLSKTEAKQSFCAGHATGHS